MHACMLYSYTIIPIKQYLKDLQKIWSLHVLKHGVVVGIVKGSAQDWKVASSSPTSGRVENNRVYPQKMRRWLLLTLISVRCSYSVYCFSTEGLQFSALFGLVMVDTL